MKKVIKVVSVIMIGLLVLTGCQKINKEAASAFKKEYEALNGQTGKNGSEYRKITIDKKNPFVTTTAEKVLEKVENGETFYVYFGDAKCPWCRSVIEKAVEVANDNKISEILYVPIWDNEGNEVLRDKFVINSEGLLEKTAEGTETYNKLLEKFDALLEYYTINTDGVISNIGEKRIFAPTFIYVKKGEATRMTTGTPEELTDPRGELTKEILDKEVSMFNDFFKGTTCKDSAGC